MNEQKIRSEIEKLTASNPYRQYAANKAQAAKLTELGLIDMMPSRFLGGGKYGVGNLDATNVIEAAEDAGGKSVGGFTAYGDGDVVRTSASPLYNALHEDPEPEPEDADEAEANGDPNGEYDPADVDPADEALDQLIDEVAEIEDAEYLAAQQAKHGAGQSDRILTVAEAAKLQGCDPMTVYRALWRGDFPRAQAIGSGARKVWLLPRRDVEQWKRSSTGRKPAK